MIKSNDNHHNYNNNNNNNNNHSYTLLVCFSIKDLNDFFSKAGFIVLEGVFSCMLTSLRSKYFSVLKICPG